MAKKNTREVTKIRTIAVYRILCRGRKVTNREILRELQDKYGIIADRKTIYSDIVAVDRFVPIKITYGRNGGYSLWDVLGGVSDGN